MGQKRSKNQIRREKQKLRKLGISENEKAGLNKSNAAKIVKSELTSNPTVPESSISTEISETGLKKSAEANGKTNEETKAAADSTKQESSPVEKAADSVKSPGTKDAQQDTEIDSGNVKDTIEVGQIDEDNSAVVESSDPASAETNTESINPTFNKLDSNKMTTESSGSTNATEVENSQGSSDEKEDNKAQLMDIFSKLTDTQPTETEEAPAQDELFNQYSSIFNKFEAKENAQSQVVAYNSGHGNGGNEASSSEESESEEEQQEGTGKTESKRQKRLREKIPISVLKASASKPQAVEWYDADAPDPYMAIHLKTALNHVNVPSHWQQKKEYLSSKRGVERAPFTLPKFIENTGIAEMRNHDPEQLKKSQRDRVQPKMGRLDIDYQKLHDAFFKHQTKPRMLAFGEVYSEGRERADKNQADVASMRPGKISKSLRLAVGMSENESAMPPWITVMQQLGKPPSYANLLIPGIDSEYTNSGYSVQYGGNAPPLDFSGTTWGSLEEGEESEAESEESEMESESESENEEKIDENKVSEFGSSGPSATALETEEERPERVEIAEYSKIKTSSSSNTATSSTSGSLYKILKETSGDGSEAGQKPRYELDEKEETAPQKVKAEEKHATPETEEFRF